MLNVLLTKFINEDASPKEVPDADKKRLYSLDNENQCKVDQTKTQQNTKDVLFI
jgi:hypothetical protein